MKCILGLLCLLNPGIEPRCPALQVNSLPFDHQESLFFLNFPLSSLRILCSFIYNIVFISAVQQCDSVIHTYTLFHFFFSPFQSFPSSTAATTAKSLRSCPTLCDPVDGSPPGSPVPGILQARTLECLPFPSQF